MNQTSIIQHVLMIIIAVAIVLLYVEPTIQEIRQNQDTAVMFNAEIEKVSAVNTLMSQKLATINSIPLADRQKLTIFMPDSAEEVSVMRTLEAVLLSSGINPITLDFSTKDDSDANASNPDEATISGRALMHKNEVVTTFETDEVTLLSYLNTITTSDIPFVLQNASLMPQENNLIGVELTYAIYNLTPEPVGIPDSGVSLEDLNLIE